MKRINAVFISYRRSDTAGEARTLYNALAHVLGEQHVFLDVDGIPLSSDFREEIRKRVGSSDLLLALIGHNFLSPAGPTAPARESNADGDTRRPDNAVDYVRLEIELALERGMAIVPVLLQGASMPLAGQLPQSIRDVAYREAFDIRHNHWNRDVAELLRRLGLKRRRSTFAIAGIAAAIAFMLAAAGRHYVWQPSGASELPANRVSPLPKKPQANAGEARTDPTVDTSSRQSEATAKPPQRPGSKPGATPERSSGTQANKSTPPVNPSPPAPQPANTTTVGPSEPTTSIPALPTLAQLREEALNRIARLENPTDVIVLRSLLQELYPGELIYSKLTFSQLITQLRTKVNGANEERLKEIISKLPQR